jgi:hypothetical protein
MRTNIENAHARLESVDRGIHTIRRIVTQPAFIIGAASVLVLIGPGRLFKMVGRGALLFNSSRRFLPKRFQRFLPRR